MVIEQIQPHKSESQIAAEPATLSTQAGLGSLSLTDVRDAGGKSSNTSLDFHTAGIYRVADAGTTIPGTGDGAAAKPLTPEEQARQNYDRARAAYKANVDDYWKHAEAAKKAGIAVTDFPPAYKGPEKPKDYDPPKQPSTLPSVNELRADSKDLFRIASGGADSRDFSLKQISESDFKQAYATEALRVGASLGLSKEETRDVVAGIYAFECGGKATYDFLSGVPLNLSKPDANGSTANQDARSAIHPLSTAIGYNQIMKATSLNFLENNADEITQRLRENAVGKPDQAQIEEKAKLYEQLHQVLHKELTEMANKDDASRAKYLKPDGTFKYSLFADFATLDKPTSNGMTGRQLANAVHSLNLDGDIGPLVQAAQLQDVLSHSLTPEMKASLQGKAQELKDRADAFDALPADKKTAAIDDIFKRAGHQNAPEMVSLRKKIESLPPGLSQDITKQNLTDKELQALETKILPLKKAGDNDNPLPPEAALLLDKLTYDHFNGPGAEAFLAPAVELGNLAGAGEAEKMLNKDNSNLPTVNFFDQKGYDANAPVQRRSADELLRTIYRVMHGANADPNNWGNQGFQQAFDSI